MAEHKGLIALIAGSTGLIGAHLLEIALHSDRYREVVTIGRREQRTQGRKHRHLVVNFDELNDWKALEQADDVFCCLGTTIKKAGSRQAFEKVDRSYPMALARKGLEIGASQFSIVTAQGASSTSPFYYNRVKGLLEEDLAGLDFVGAYVFRPTLLLGERSEKRRGEEFAERAFRILSPIMRGPLAKLKPIDARDVAAAMLCIAEEAPAGLKAFEAEDIRGIVASRESDDS
jgi:uncharacterized protein YbjT (DUF2867 family)